MRFSGEAPAYPGEPQARSAKQTPVPVQGWSGVRVSFLPSVVHRVHNRVQKTHPHPRPTKAPKKEGVGVCFADLTRNAL